MKWIDPSEDCPARHCESRHGLGETAFQTQAHLTEALDEIETAMHAGDRNSQDVLGALVRAHRAVSMALMKMQEMEEKDV